ncbi:MAG: hypothetical protein ABR915_18475, partial [Thermoguttaceae bacterium]
MFVRNIIRTVIAVAMIVGVLPVAHAAQTLVAEKPELVPIDTSTFGVLAADLGLRLIAPRQGYASSLAVVRGPKIAGVATTPPRLTGPGGAVLPPEAVQIRWLSGDQFTPSPVPGQYMEGRAVLGQQVHIVLTVHAPKAAAA